VRGAELEDEPAAGTTPGAVAFRLAVVTVDEAAVAQFKSLLNAWRLVPPGARQMLLLPGQCPLVLAALPGFARPAFGGHERQQMGRGELPEVPRLAGLPWTSLAGTLDIDRGGCLIQPPRAQPVVCLRSAAGVVDAQHAVVEDADPEQPIVIHT